MTDQVWLAVITGLPATIAALGSVFLAIKNGAKVDAAKLAVDAVNVKTDLQHAQTTDKIDSTKQSVNVLERQINSNLEKQIEASIAKAIANERLRVAGLVQPNNSATEEEARVAKDAHDSIDEKIEGNKEKNK
jgi:TolA-binding protein